MTLLGSQRNPPKGRETEFAYMITIDATQITYAVDHQGHIWQKKYPIKEIVGRTEAAR